jgi:hypothetical protein
MPGRSVPPRRSRSYDRRQIVLLGEYGEHFCGACAVLVNENYDSSLKLLRPQAFGNEANGLINDRAGISNDQPQQCDLGELHTSHTGFYHKSGRTVPGFGRSALQ